MKGSDAPNKASELLAAFTNPGKEMEEESEAGSTAE